MCDANPLLEPDDARFTNPFRLSESILVSVVGKLHNPMSDSFTDHLFFLTFSNADSSPAHLAVLCELLRELDLLQRHAGPWLQVISLPIALVKLLAGLHSVTSSAPLLTELHPCALRRVIDAMLPCPPVVAHSPTLHRHPQTLPSPGLCHRAPYFLTHLVVERTMFSTPPSVFASGRFNDCVTNLRVRVRILHARNHA